MLTVRGVSKELKVSVSTIRSWRKAGKLQACKVNGYWRVETADLDKFLAERANY